MLTQGRLVPRQPWAIKRTTPTALRGYNIRHGGFIHGSAGIISTALRGYNIRNDGFTHGSAGIISTALRGYNIRNDGFTHGNAGIISTVLRFFNFISFKRRSGAKDVCRIDEPYRLLLLIAISKGRVGAKR